LDRIGGHRWRRRRVRLPRPRRGRIALVGHGNLSPELHVRLMPDINLRIQIEGVNAILQGFQRVVTNPKPAMAELQKRVLERLRAYPPERPGQTYVRTGDLGRAWAVSIDARGTNLFQDRVSAELHNEVTGPSGRSYAAWVQGDPKDGGPSQVPIHQGRWTTTREALDEETGPFLQELGNEVERA